MSCLPRDWLPRRREGPKSPRWLWIVAGAAVLLVVALVIALVLANDAIKTQTAVPPLPAMPELESGNHDPDHANVAAVTAFRGAAAQRLCYADRDDRTRPRCKVSSTTSAATVARSASCTVDTGDVIQTEFNVALPWSKEVSLSKSAAHPANVTIVNIGHNVTCSVTVDGVQVSQRVGVGITICDAEALGLF